MILGGEAGGYKTKVKDSLNTVKKQSISSISDHLKDPGKRNLEFMVARTAMTGDTKILIRSDMQRNELCMWQTFAQGICHIPKIHGIRD